MALEAGIRPWVGKNYKQARSKILLLGEAHYLSETREAGPSYTINLVREHVCGKPIRFLTKVTCLIPLTSLPTSSRGKFWNDIAYTNFISYLVGSSAREKPCPRDYDAGRKRYPALLKKLRPEFVYVCGYRLWDEMEVPSANDSSAEFNGAHHLRSMHPSTSLKYEEWRANFAAFLGARRRRVLEAMRRDWMDA